MIMSLLIHHLVLDPRISLIGALYDCAGDVDMIRHVHDCKQQLELHYKDHYALKRNTNVALTTATTTPKRPTRSWQDIIDYSPLARYKISSPDGGSLDELHQYFALDRAHAQTLRLDILSWWKVHENTFPCLSRLAKDVYSLPGALLFYSFNMFG
jgi:hypothetical protein